MGKQKNKGGKHAKGGKKKKGGYADLEDESDTEQQHGQSRGGRQQGKKKGKRKPKGGKAESTSTHDDDSFRKTLLSNGSFSINEMSADGNCCFRSLSDQLYGDYGNRHDVIRQEICGFLEDNKDEFAVFLLLDEGDEDVCDFDTYVGKMKEDGEWGGNVELVAAARLYRRTITIFSPTGAFSIESGHDDESGDKVLLSYHDNGHYNSVRDENVTIKPVINCSVVASEAEHINAGNGGRKKKKRGKASSNTSRPGGSDGEEERKEDGGLETVKAAVVNEESREEDSSERIEDPGEAPETKPSKREEKADNRKIVLRKNDPCPCGSGLRYKKCCLAVEKRKIRAAKWKEKHGLDGGRDEGGGGGGDGEEDQCADLDNPFRVLKI